MSVLVVFIDESDREREMLRHTISNNIIKLQKKYRKNKIHVSTLFGKRNFVMYSYRYMKRPSCLYSIMSSSKHL